MIVPFSPQHCTGNAISSRRRNKRQGNRDWELLIRPVGHPPLRFECAIGSASVARSSVRRHAEKAPVAASGHGVHTMRTVWQDPLRS